MSSDVLRNLEMLRQAQSLLQHVRELCDAGQVCQAMECLALAHDLCPGSWLDRRIEEASAEIVASAYCDSPQADEAASSAAPRTPDAVPLRPGLPPVDPQIPVFLDQLYPEDAPLARPPFLDAFKDFTGFVAPQHGELSVGPDGSVRLFTQLRPGGSVWHVVYNNGGLAVWASPDGGADAAASTENTPADGAAK